jgi:hypothetical protein
VLLLSLVEKLVLVLLALELRPLELPPELEGAVTQTFSTQTAPGKQLLPAPQRYVPGVTGVSVQPPSAASATANHLVPLTT